MDDSSRGYGWRRTLSAAALPDVIRPMVESIIAKKMIDSCARCGAFARISDYDGLDKSVRSRHQPFFDVGGHKARARTPLLAWATFHQNLLTIANQTDKGDVIDLDEHAMPAQRAWYELMRTSEFVPSECRFNTADGDFVAWASGSILGLEGLAAKKRGTGSGRRILTEICRAADKYGARILGVVEPYEAFNKPPSLTLEQLHAWYGRHGFVRVRDAGHQEAIERTPQRIDK